MKGTQLSKIIIQIELIYYPIVAAIGVPVNLVTIVILSRGKCGLSTCITRYLVAMAVADLLVVITDVMWKRISVTFTWHFIFLNLTPICCIREVLFHATTTCSVWLTIAFTFDRFAAICRQKLKTKYCTEKTATVVIVSVCAFSCVINIPRYLEIEPLFIINNKPWFCVVKPSFYYSWIWTAFQLLQCILTPFIPFVLILLLNVLTIRYILVTNAARRRLRGHSNGEHQNDAEMQNRRRSIILLFTVTGSFICLWVTYVITYIQYQVEFMALNLTSDAGIVLRVGNMLRLFSCSTNTCIYALTQSKFRKQLKNMMNYPLYQILILIRS
ncbi:probable G-protein coupled receptor 139 [Callorhinchus milii]|uniref:probable G-protein coupled receptor 139 n=1 Tax=Callorhinchus milii TaxID=7868 RepID=UPI001C3FC64D|nr:probable G-protein coupled receptor 139 [Callorhinchus milii]XP_042202346.1 probable G-protein coupled receptor 139 [Callorhinchus milii]